jgi:predicted PurR-regulated permease PerM
MPDRPPAQPVEIIVPFRTLLVILAFATVVLLAVLTLGTLISIFLATVIALGLDPVVTWLVQRRGWKRGPTAVFVFAAVFVAVFVLVLVTAGPVWDQIVAFVNQLPEMWDQLTATDGFQQIISTAGADDTIKNLLKDLAAGLPDAATALLGVAGSVFGSVLSLVTLTFLSLFLVMERPMIENWLFGFTPPETEARWRPVVDESIMAVSQSLLGNIAISIVAGTYAFVSCVILGLPFPLVLAVIAGFLDLIPQVGATIASIILVAVALTVGTTEALIMLALQLIYQQVENYIIYPIVYRRAVELSAFTTIVSVLIAGAILGVAGAILAVPFAAVIKTVLREAGAPRRERMDAMRLPEVSPANGDGAGEPIGSAHGPAPG